MSSQIPEQSTPSKTPTVDLLTSVVMRKKGVKPTYKHEINGNTYTFTTPYIGNDNEGFRHLNAISKYDMGADVKKLSAKQPAGWVAVQRTVLAALVYAASATIPPSHPYHKEMQQEKGKIIPIDKELTNLKRRSSRTPEQESKIKELEKKKQANLRKVNDIWRTRFNKNDVKNNYQATIDLAEAMVESALTELDAQTALQPYSIDAAKKAARDLLTLNQAHLVREAGYTPEEGKIYTEFNYGQSTSNQFLMQRFGSTDFNDYLPKLLRENVSGLAPTFSISAKALDDLVANTPIVADNIDIRSIPKSDYKGCVDEVKNGRVGMKLIAKKDGHTDTYNLLVVMHKFVGGQAEQYSEILNAKAIDPFDRDDKAYQQFLQSGNVTPYTDAERDQALTERIEKERLLQIENHARVVADNEQKLKEARREYLTKTEVSNVDQLVGTYFEQKGLAELAVKHLRGMRVEQGKVWLPLSDVIAESKEVNSTNGYQQLLSEKVNLAPDGEEPHLTNKLFNGIGQGEKYRCFYTIGNPETASVILESEGVANGLIEYDMLSTRGYNVAVVCALDAGNINHATRSIIEQHPTKAIVNIADNDRFDKHGNERVIDKSIDNANTIGDAIDGNAPKENIGLKVATNLNKAVGVPFGYIDFSKINGHDFTEQQRQNKLSDIDDLVSVLVAANTDTNSSKEQVKEAAYKEAGDYLEHITTDALKRDVNPHFSTETQHETKWVGSTRNLSNPNLRNFHFLKKAIANAQRVFIESNDRRMEYSTYQMLLNRVGSMDELDVEFNTQTATPTDSPQAQYHSVEATSAHIAKDMDIVDVEALEIQAPTKQHVDIETIKDKLSSILIEISELDDAIMARQDKYDENPTDINERLLGKLNVKMEDLLAIRETLQSEISALNIQTSTAKPSVAQKEPTIESAPTSAELTSWETKYSALKDALDTYKSHVSDLQKQNPQLDNLRLINAQLLEAHIEPFDAPQDLWEKATQHPIDNQTLQSIFSVFDQHLSSIEKSYMGDEVTENEKDIILHIIDDATKDINHIVQIDAPQIETTIAEQPSAETEQTVEAQSTDPEPQAVAPEQPSAETEQTVEAQGTEPEPQAEAPEQPSAEPEQTVEAQSTESEPQAVAPEQPSAENKQAVETQSTEPEPQAETPEQPSAETEQSVEAQGTEPEPQAETPEQPSAETEQSVEAQGTEPEPQAEAPEQPSAETEQAVEAQGTEPELQSDAPEQPSAETEQAVEAQSTEPEPQAETPEQPSAQPEQSVEAQSTEPEPQAAAPEQPSAEPEQTVEAQGTEPEPQAETPDQPSAEPEQSVEAQSTEPEPQAESPEQPSAETEQTVEAQGTEPEPQAAAPEQPSAENEQAVETQSTEPEPQADAPEQPSAETEQAVEAQSTETELQSDAPEQPSAETEQSVEAQSTEPEPKSDAPEQPSAQPEQSVEAQSTEPEPKSDAPEQPSAQPEQSVEAQSTEPEPQSDAPEQPSAEPEQTVEAQGTEPEPQADVPEQPSAEAEPAVEATYGFLGAPVTSYSVTLRNKAIATDIWQPSPRTPNKFATDELRADIGQVVQKLRAIEDLKQKIAELEAIQKFTNIAEKRAEVVQRAKPKQDAPASKSTSKQSPPKKSVEPKATTESKVTKEKVDNQDNPRRKNRPTQKPKQKPQMKKQSAAQVAAAINAGAAQTPPKANEQQYKDAVKAVNIGEKKKFKQLDKPSKDALKTAIERKLVLNTDETVSQRMIKQPKETHDKLRIVSNDAKANNSIMAGAIIAFDSPRAHKNPNLSEAAIGDFVFEEIFGTEHDDKYYMLKNMISETSSLDEFYDNYKAEIGEGAFNAKFGQEVTEYEKTKNPENNREVVQEAAYAPDEYDLEAQPSPDQDAYQEYMGMSQ